MADPYLVQALIGQKPPMMKIGMMISLIGGLFLLIVSLVLLILNKYVYSMISLVIGLISLLKYWFYRKRFS